MQTSRFSAALPHGRLGRFTGAIILALGLLGCSQQPSQKVTSRTDSSLSEPDVKIVDYQLVSCQHIWAFDDVAATGNPLYWLRTIDCGVRLSPADARAEARRWPLDDWQSAFKQAVLLNNGNVTPVERRQYLSRLDGYSYDYPASVRPLMMLWREGQGSLLQLSEERTRYAHLQESSDGQLDALRQHQIVLKNELAITRRKLDTLTDIERRLSSRRSPDAADTSSHGNEKNSAADNSSQDDANP
ncbi:two-component system QseEF-associated lipoprotein QseG [Erwinia sorbitola]|uniref:Two-component system QseEF-associated lipoprotein QseG n=1 Tax=Erwinia sorbitola TaxID=2681984 RepID=A0A6I6EK20_9GAMM|nr:two-component system QseEF-associated lipoprotein QseG [Erwinia sorbitola]MTD28526.1 two-component system QseEF-associated lipoprotein QseG [Erwinia sorbitola]QGU86636.1 two-component system QseEF-associated lipoprotein QseG [Erwinia sorbitola]